MSAVAMPREVETIDDFRRAMAERGIPVSEDLIADGKLHRYHVKGDKKGSRNAWAVLHLDGERPAGAFGCNRRWSGEKFTWSSKSSTPLTPEVRQAFRERMEAQRAEREAEKLRLSEAAAQHAAFMWGQGTDPVEHPYLTRKGVRAHGVRVGPWEKIDHDTGDVITVCADALLIPIRDTAKRLRSMQAIYPQKRDGRDKDYLRDGVKEGNFFAIGKPKTIKHKGRPRMVIMVGEGYATVASAHEATGHAGIVAFDAPNLLPVAKALHAKFPDALFVFLSDHDQWTVPTPEHPHIVANPGLTRALEAVKLVGGVVALPPFERSEGKPDENGKLRGPTDFNDWHQTHGLESVRKVIDEAMTTPMIVVLAPDGQSATGAAYAMRALMAGDEISGEVTNLSLSNGHDLVVEVYGDDLAERTAELCKRKPSARVYILARRGEEEAARDVALLHGVYVETLAEFGRGQFDNWFDAMVAEVDAKADADPVARELAGGALKRATRAVVQDVHNMPCVHETAWPHLDMKRMKPLNTIPNLRHMLSNYSFTLRYDVIRKEMQVTHPGQRGTMDNVKSKVVDTVISLCALNQLPKTDTPSFLLSIADDNPCNPVMDFITSKPWDGISRFDDLLATVQTKPGFDRDLLALLMRRWLVAAVAAAAKPIGFWSKGVLVFQGSQSLGKTSWFRELLPAEMRDLVKVDAHIDPANKDTIISAVSHWMVELGELDGTLRKADIARLKGFISQDIDQFRRPYGRADEKFQRRTVFFASVNPEHFLADDTGNVRWWTVPVIGINSGHGIDMQQMWAEVFTWFQARERWWLDPSEEARLNATNTDHEQGNPVDELIASKYDFAGVTRRRLTATEVLLELHYVNPSRKLLNETAEVMRKHFGAWVKSNGRKVYQVPNLFNRH